MYKLYVVYICLIITLTRFCSFQAVPNVHQLVLQTDDSFYVATFRKSADNTTLNLESLSNLNYTITDAEISSFAVCEFFLYFTTPSDSFIHRLALSTQHHHTIQKSITIDNLAIDPLCHSLFFSAPSSLQISASNTSADYLTPRILSTDQNHDNEISSLSYDYVNFQLLYTSTRGEVYQLGFNNTKPNQLWKSEGKQIINSALSQSHLFTLEKNASHLTLWRSDLTQLARDPPVPVRTWDISEYFDAFIVTADGEWLFYIDPENNQLGMMDISTNDQTLAESVLFPNLTNIRTLRLIPDIGNQLRNEGYDPCLSSKCKHLCLPISRTESTCSCPNGERQLTQQCTSQLEGSTLITTTDGIHVLRTGDSLALSLLPLTGYAPYKVRQLTAADDWVYWSEDYTSNGIPYSIIRKGSIQTGHTNTILSELLGQISGLVVDRLSDNLFWSDRVLRRIEVSRTNGLHRRVLYDNDVIKGDPFNLVADLVQSVLYWCEEVDGVYRILSAPMDSSIVPRVLFDNISSLTHLAVDASNNLLYWSDNEGVNSVNTSEVVPSINSVFKAVDISVIAIENSKVFNLRRANSTSLYTDTSLLLKYPNKILSISHIPDDRDRLSSCRSSANAPLNCPHLCLPAISAIQHSCICSIGFQLKSASNCEEIGESLYLSQPGSLNVYQREDYITAKPSLETTSGTATSITGDVRRGHIYWSDTHEGVIGRMDNEGKNFLKVQEGFHSIHGLAFDALSENLYWSDNATGVLGISVPDGSLQKVLIHARDDIPFSLVSDPLSGEIYFSTQSSPLSIRSMYGNTGLNQQLVRTRGLALSLTIDKNSNELIWARKASTNNQWKPIAQKCTLPNCDDAMTFFDLDINIYGQAVGPDKFYSAASLISYPETYFLQQQYMPLGSFEQIISLPIHRPGALYLSHISSQPKQHYCAINNGGCSHFCLLAAPNLVGAPQDYVCECPVHMKLSTDGRNCELRETFLFVMTEFYILALNKYPYVVDEAVPVGTLQNSSFVSFDPIDYVVYWVSDTGQNESVIQSFGLNRGEMRPSIVARINNSESIFNFEVDWVGKYAFWTRSNGHSIEFADLESGNAGYIFHNLSFNPRALALDPITSRVFFSDWSDTPSIRSIGLDGRDLQIVVGSEFVSRPSSLTYSQKHGSLFWYDYDRHIIAQYNFNTENVTVYDIIPDTGDREERDVTQDAYNKIKVAISGDELVWWEKFSQPRMTRFHYFHLLTHSTTATDMTSVGSVYDMTGHTIDSRIHHKTHPCRTNYCHGICSQSADVIDEDFNCTCPLYTYFSASSLSCEPYQCPYTSSCIPGQECVQPEWRCDGKQDCMDASDEASCISKCSVDQFTCNTTLLCIAIEKRCDGGFDCEDNSDEIGCMASNSSVYTTLPSTTTRDLDAFEKSYMSVFLGLVMTIILLFIVCIFILILWLICLHRPFYRRFQYKVKSRKDDLENTRSSPTYSESEIRSTNSTNPILDTKSIHKSVISRPIPIINTEIVAQSPDILVQLDEHYNSAPLCFGYRSAPLSLDVPTVDLVSIVTDQSLDRSDFDYDNFSDARVPPPSVNTNHSSVMLSVSQQDIPTAVESGLPDGTTLRTGSQLIEYPHPNSEITALTSTYFQPMRPNHMSCPSSHYTLVTTNISSFQPASINS